MTASRFGPDIGGFRVAADSAMMGAASPGEDSLRDERGGNPGPARRVARIHTPTRRVLTSSAPTCYYAHCLSLYGTPQEDRDLRTIMALGFHPLNPNAEKYDARAEALKAEGRGARVMEEVFLPLVEGCDALAFRALPDGAIPSGVAKEVELALRLELPVIELPNALVRRFLPLDETREYLRDVGQR